MIELIAHIAGGVTARVEFGTAELAVAYAAAQPVQPEAWEVHGTPEEEAEFAARARREPALRIFFAESVDEPPVVVRGPA